MIIPVETAADSRGRNGYFRARSIDVHQDAAGNTEITAFSSVAAVEPPIILNLDRRAACSLAASIIAQHADHDNQRRKAR